MQCPRCYFTNPSGTRVCEYCGARLESTTDVGAGGGGSASQKRKTMLGPIPSNVKSGARPLPKITRKAPMDPDDPFRIAAQGVSPDTPPPPAPEPPPTPADAPTKPASRARTPPEGQSPPVARDQPQDAPAKPNPPAAPQPPAPPKRSHRATVVTLARPDEPAVAGAAIVIPQSGSASAVLLREGRTRIGRRDGMEILLADPKASTDHALLRIENGEAWLLDTSANGTVVSGVPCVNDRANVTDGAVLRVGDTLIVLKLIGEDAMTYLAREP